MKVAGIICLLVPFLGVTVVSLSAGDYNLQDLLLNYSQVELFQTKLVQIQPVQTETSAPNLHHFSSASNCSDNQCCGCKEMCEAAGNIGLYCVQPLYGIFDEVGYGILFCTNISLSHSMPLSQWGRLGNVCCGWNRQKIHIHIIRLTTGIINNL